MITVLMPCFNAAETIGVAIQSVLASHFKDFELLIVDDGSTDSTPEIIERFEDPRIRLLYHPENRGLAAALNTGLSEAAYSVIMRMDADDITHPERMGTLYEYVREAPNRIVACNYAAFDSTGIRYCLTNPADHHSILRRLPLHSSLLHSSMMYHKEFILSSGGYKSIPLEDYELLLRLHKNAEFHCHQQILHCMRLRSGSLTADSLYKPGGAAYRIQQPFYNAGLHSFGYTDTGEENILRGWREYFYGTGMLCRNYWYSVPLGKWDKRMCIAVLFTLLPGRIREQLKNIRPKQQIEFYSGKNAGELTGLQQLIRNYQ